MSYIRLHILNINGNPLYYEIFSRLGFYHLPPFVNSTIAIIKPFFYRHQNEFLLRRYIEDELSGKVRLIYLDLTQFSFKLQFN